MHSTFTAFQSFIALIRRTAGSATHATNYFTLFHAICSSALCDFRDCPVFVAACQAAFRPRGCRETADGDKPASTVEYTPVQTGREADEMPVADTSAAYPVEAADAWDTEEVADTEEAVNEAAVAPLYNA